MDFHLSTSKRQRTSYGNVNRLEMGNVNRLKVGNVNQIDQFDRLPNDILMLILDKLPMEAAIQTSFLSKRWRGLWKFKSRIDMGYSWVQRTDKLVLPSLFELLQDHQEPKIKCLSVAVRYDPSVVFEVGLLMRYASIKNVEELYLDINDRNDPRKRWARRYPLIFLPDVEVLPCICLRKMSMKFLLLETLPRSRFEALRELLLEHVILFYDSVTRITKHCHSLELLSLSNCNPKRDLEVTVAEGSNLCHLIIKEDLNEVNRKTKLFIKAVDVKTLEFGSALPRKEYHVEVGLQCSESIIRLTEMYHSRQALRVTSSGLQGNFSNNFLGLLHDLKAVKKLTLSSWCIQVLSIEFAKFKVPQDLEVIHLVLETKMKRWEFPGIAYMLLACHKLESLVIVLGDHAELNFKHLKGFRHHGDVAYPRALQDLTVVEFRNLGGAYQTWEDGAFDVDRFFAGFEYADLLLWNLRTCAKNLSKIVFVTRRMRYETDQVQSFEKLRFYRMIHPYDYRVPGLFANQLEWDPEASTSTA